MISITGLLLGCWLTLGGLELRIFGSYPTWHQQFDLFRYPEHLFRFANLELGPTAALGWPMVVFGTSWGGALLGFWTGERWSRTAMIMLSVLALPFPLPGTLLGTLQLLLIRGSYNPDDQDDVPVDGT